MKLRALLVLLIVFSSATFAVRAQTALNENFETLSPTGQPVGWNDWNPNARVIAENGNRFVRFVNTDATKNVAIGTRVPLDASWQHIQISVRMRGNITGRGAETWFAPRVTLQFQNAENQMVGAWPAVMSLEQSRADWTTLQHVYSVPKGATQVFINPGLWGTSGTLDLDDVQVEPFDYVSPKMVPAQELTTQRAKIDLNGVWKFAPSNGQKAADADWGAMKVPGSWMRASDVLARGESWKDFAPKTLAAAWYERTIDIPSAWSNRAILLEFERVSTDATVWVNDREVGRISWPTGTLDITSAVTAGQSARIRVLVVATSDQKDVLVLMGQAPGQTYTAKAELPSGGLIGGVELLAVPRGARVENVQVQTSVRRKTLGLDVELAGVQDAGDVQIEAVLVDENGREEKQFQHTVTLDAQNPLQVPAEGARHFRVEWSWANPRLWDVGQPNLYTLRLRVRGAGVDDEWAQQFGFRELWIEGRKLFLNGSEFRMRPTLLGSGAFGSGGEDIVQAMSDGFNIGELWPEDIEQRGYETPYASRFDSADKLGFLVTGILPHMGWMGNNIDTPEEAARYEAAARREMQRFGQHPSLVMWGSSGNMIGGPLDPSYIGTRAKAIAHELAKKSESGRRYPLVDAMIARLKTFDPTRPIFIHNGGPAGDLYTVNNYLDFIPLQEREEWLSRYMQQGDMPLFYVEFGTPLYSSVMRGRNGYGNTTRSEPLLSEYAAIYFGTRAYRNEAAAYRSEMSAQFVQGQEYKNWHANQALTSSPNFLQLQSLFLQNTWRSWRTWGISGGMIPWDAGYARQNGKLTIAGRALQENNSSTLAWIAGAPDFTDKTHNFAVAQTVRKQIALLNDTRASQTYTVKWRAVLNGKTIAQGAESGALAIAQTRLQPLNFTLPKTLASKARGVIELDATIGAQTHRDSFDFTVFAPQPKARGSVLLFDPAGKTRVLLKNLGFQVIDWNGKNRQNDSQLLVIGRETLSHGTRVPGDWRAWVQNGGRVLMMAQSPQWMRDYLGWRVSYLQSRRVFRVSASPATGNLDDEDLRDWSGSSTLLTPRPDYLHGSGPDAKLAPTNYPYTGWRWGNRGVVSSAAIEKPHRSGWRPLLECEFDLAYSPLMELDFGRGRLVWCQLDVEDHSALDPAARLLTQQIVEYALTAALAPRAQTFYSGDAAGRAKLDALGVNYRVAASIPATAQLLIVGNDSPLNASDVETFARNGGQVLALPRAQSAGGWGVVLASKPGVGSLDVPDWPQTRGLSASDLRWRSQTTAWLLQSGAQIGGGGQIGRKLLGKGAIVWCQIDPDRFDADTNTYFRLTRWRQTRALSQLIANLGGSFQMDARVFTPRLPTTAPEIDLSGQWQAKLVQRLDAAPDSDTAHADTGFSNQARAILAGAETDWQTVKAPGDMESYGGAWQNADGEAVFRKEIEVPATLQKQDLQLSLGTLDDFDDTFFNGTRVGGLSAQDKDSWGVERHYTVPAALVKPGRNVITVRIWDRFGGGGFTGKLTAMKLEPLQKSVEPAGFYHRDYRADFDLGDEPYRYYNW